MHSSTVLLSLAILPVIILGTYVYRKDKYDKEPLSMLMKAFFFGCLSIFPASLMESWLTGVYELMGGKLLPGAFEGIYTGYVVAGCSEEFCKLVMLWLAVWRSRYFDEYFDGIVYATFVSLGFAGLENIMYVFGQEDFASSIATGTMRAVLAVPGHFLFGVVMGYYFALAKFQPERRFGNLVKAFVFSMLLHGTYDSLLMVPEYMGIDGSIFTTVFFALFIYFDVKLWKVGMKRLRDLQRIQAEEEAGRWSDSDYSDHGSSSNLPKDPFSGFTWNF